MWEVVEVVEVEVVEVYNRRSARLCGRWWRWWRCMTGGVRGCVGGGGRVGSSCTAVHTAAQWDTAAGRHTVCSLAVLILLKQTLTGTYPVSRHKLLVSSRVKSSNQEQRLNTVCLSVFLCSLPLLLFVFYSVPRLPTRWILTRVVPVYRGEAVAVTAG